MRSYRGLSVRVCRLTSYAQTGCTVTKLVFRTDSNGTKPLPATLIFRVLGQGTEHQACLLLFLAMPASIFGQIAKVKSASSYLSA